MVDVNGNDTMNIRGVHNDRVAHAAAFFGI
jgi:hypothetical protein